MQPNALRRALQMPQPHRGSSVQRAAEIFKLQQLLREAKATQTAAAAHRQRRRQRLRRRMMKDPPALGSAGAAPRPVLQWKLQMPARALGTRRWLFSAILIAIQQSALLVVSVEQLSWSL